MLAFKVVGFLSALGAKTWAKNLAINPSKSQNIASALCLAGLLQDFPLELSLEMQRILARLEITASQLTKNWVC